MEKTKNMSVYLEESQIRYLKLVSMMHGLNSSEYLRTLIDDDMCENEEICRQFETIIFKEYFSL